MQLDSVCFVTYSLVCLALAPSFEYNNSPSSMRSRAHPTLNICCCIVVNQQQGCERSVV